MGSRGPVRPTRPPLAAWGGGMGPTGTASLRPWLIFVIPPETLVGILLDFFRRHLQGVAEAEHFYAPGRHILWDPFPLEGGC